jgi:hypothetical protein
VNHAGIEPAASPIFSSRARSQCANGPVWRSFPPVIFAQNTSSSRCFGFLPPQNGVGGAILFSRWPIHLRGNHGAYAPSKLVDFPSATALPQTLVSQPTSIVLLRPHWAIFYPNSLFRDSYKRFFSFLSLMNSVVFSLQISSIEYLPKLSKAQFTMHKMEESWDVFQSGTFLTICTNLS